MLRRRRRFHAHVNGALYLEDERFARWTLRALVLGGAHLRWDGLDTDTLLAVAQVPAPSEAAAKSPAGVLRYLRRQLALAEERDLGAAGPIHVNAGKLVARLGMGLVERDLIALALLTHLGSGLADLLTPVSVGSPRRFAELLAAVLDLPAAEVRSALRPESPLRAAGLLRPAGRPDHGDGPLALLDGIDAALLDDAVDDAQLLGHFLAPAGEATLVRADFAHLEDPVALAATYLGRALDARAAGVNVLLHGPPGTGKTELCRVLAAEIGASLHAVRTEDADGDPLPGGQRLDSLRLCQQLLRGSGRALVLFDEIEDVFPVRFPAFLGIEAPAAERKGFMNHVLEHNAVPTLWVTNAVASMDPAVLRRFDCHLSLPVPPLPVRRRVLARHLEGLPVNAEDLTPLVASPHVTPADLARATRVGRAFAGDGPDVVRRVLGQTLEAALDARGRTLARRDPHEHEVFDPTLASPTTDLGVLVEALRREPRGKLCLAGPPGSGKTAFAFHLGRELGLEVVARRASDLLGMYVGQTEAALARMFREARPGRTLLLLDEADSFLQDRAGAEHGWQVTQVNELLVQIEAYDGLFVACTNRLPTFDSAVHRRFDLAVGFGALGPAQRRRLVAELVGATETAALPPRLAERLDRLADLTAGDLAALRKQSRFLPGSLDAEAVITALERRKAAGEEPRRPVGFRG